jgi:hypothetical protein
MTVSEFAASLAAAAGALLVIGLLIALIALGRTLRVLRVAVEELRQETIPLVSDMRATVGQANTELSRVDTLITRAESIGGTVDSASRLAYLAFSNPLIKALAFGAGTTRAARRLRRKSDPEER